MTDVDQDNGHAAVEPDIPPAVARRRSAFGKALDPVDTGTAEAYRRRYLGLERQARSDLAMDQGEFLSPQSFAAWLIGKRAKVTRATWYQYRAACLWCLEREGVPGAHEAVEMIRGAAAPSRGDKAQRVRAAKAKVITQVDLDFFIEACNGTKSAQITLIGVILTASIVAGLRPREWVSASLSDTPPRPPGQEQLDHPFFQKGPWLTVQNAKTTQGRSFGPVRHLNLGPLNPSELVLVETCIAQVADAVGGDRTAWPDVEELLIKAMWRKTRSLWPRRATHYTLYSGRHTFAARAKQFFSQAEVAALMGHISDETAGRHYGRASSRGTAGIGDIPWPLPVPDPAAVEMVLQESLNRRPTTGPDGVPAAEIPNIDF